MKDAYLEFESFIKDQFEYGGKKYKLDDSQTRESTDVLFDKHGKNWLIGTIDKYTFRYSNLARERDLLKIATYMYLMWLKRGFQVTNEGINDPPIDTNIDLKRKYFPDFARKTRADFIANQAYYNQEKFNIISAQLGTWSKGEWSKITQGQMIIVFNISFVEWSKKYAKVVQHDTDTYKNEQTNNETEKK